MSEYPRIDITVDAVVFGEDNDTTYVLLIQRKKDPFKDCWAIPGGFVDEGETLEQAVVRELEEETSIQITNLKQLHTFSDPKRDPRKRIISAAFYTVINKNDVNPVAADDASNLSWFNINELPVLAFDHEEILNMAIKKINV